MPLADDPRRNLATEIAMLFAREVLRELPEIEALSKHSDRVKMNATLSLLRNKQGRLFAELTVGPPSFTRRRARVQMVLSAEQIELFERG